MLGSVLGNAGPDTQHSLFLSHTPTTIQAQYTCNKPFPRKQGIHWVLWGLVGSGAEVGELGRGTIVQYPADKLFGETCPYIEGIAVVSPSIFSLFLSNPPQAFLS